MKLDPILLNKISISSFVDEKHDWKEIFYLKWLTRSFWQRLIINKIDRYFTQIL